MALGDRQLLAWRFASQGLAGRTGPSTVDVAGRVGGLQAQDTGAVRLAVRARSGVPTLDAVRRDCAVPRRLVRTWLMRGTLHLVPAADARWMLSLFGPRNAAGGARRRAQLRLDDETCEAAVSVLPDILGDGQPLSRAELVDRLARRGVRIDATGQAPAHLVGYAAALGVICRGPDLERDEPGYVLLDAWAGTGPGPVGAEAVAELARRYVAGFGPASAADFAAWSGLPAGSARTAFEALGEALTPVAPDLFVAAGSAAPPDGGPPMVRLLGAYDTYLLGYRAREPALAAGYAKRIQAGGGIIHPTVVVDGRVAGRWRLERGRSGRTVHIEQFGPTLGTLIDRLAEEAGDLGRFLGEPVTLGDLS
jgi:Winged helix DNA-binding domain